MGRILPCLVPVLACNLHKQGGHTSHFSSSCSPDQQRALLEPWERRGEGERCLRTSSAPFPPSLLRRLQCPAPVCLCRLLLCCCGPRRSAKQTHSPAIWAKQQQQRGEGRPCLQSVVVQQQEGNTGRAAAGGTTAADRYCRLRVVHGDCCMLVQCSQP